MWNLWNRSGSLGWDVSSVLCKQPVFLYCGIPGKLNGPERRVGLCGDATRAPTQGPGFRGARAKLGSRVQQSWRKSDKSRGFGGQSPHIQKCSSSNSSFAKDLRQLRFWNPVAEQNCEALQGGFPVLHRHGPLLGNVPQGQVQQFHSGFRAGKRAPRLDHLA